MERFNSIEQAWVTNAWVSIGSFDGVHLGHQKLIRQMVTTAHSTGDSAVILNFHPHPAVVLGRRRGFTCLSTLEEQAVLLEALGVDVFITHPFDLQLAAMGAAEFMTYLQRHLGMRSLWIGHDFALGRGREGDEAALRKIGGELGYDVNCVDAVRLDGMVVSSTRVRARLAEGDIGAARQLLGRNYQVSGRVIPGDQRGRKIGFPTANLDVDQSKLIPAIGVYACRVRVAGELEWRLAATNIGMRPTFADTDGRLHIETHLIDYTGDLYGKVMCLEFVDYLRGEKQFSGKDALIAQICEDIQRTRERIDLGE